MSALGLLFDLYARLDPEPGYWIEIEDGGDGMDYCLRCVKAKDDGKGRYSTHGSASEQDHCLHCSECGKLLAYVLTDCGAKEELAHFKSAKFRRPLDREVAYHIARLIDALPHDFDSVAVGARAIRAMKRLPKQSSGAASAGAWCAARLTGAAPPSYR